jgi:hypothetical protein
MLVEKSTSSIKRLQAFDSSSPAAFVLIKGKASIYFDEYDLSLFAYHFPVASNLNTLAQLAKLPGVLKSMLFNLSFLIEIMSRRTSTFTDRIRGLG